jgi:membrane protease YdiL (CAAX protease family)
MTEKSRPALPGGIPRGEVAVFVALVLPLSWGIMLLARAGTSRAGSGIAMTVPMIVALVFLLRRHRGLATIGWRVPRWPYCCLAIGLPLLLLGLVLLIDWMAGWIAFNPEYLLNRFPTPHLWLNLILAAPGMFVPFLILSPVALISGWVSHLGEEFAWRGYLFRSLFKRSGHPLPAVVLTGLVWWLWHLPFFPLSPALSKLTAGPLLLLLATSLPALIGTSALYAWAYVASGSIWTPTALHLFWNLYRGILTGRLADGAAGLFTGSLWLVNGEGVIGNLVSALAGLIFMVLLVRRSGSLEPAAVP